MVVTEAISDSFLSVFLSVIDTRTLRKKNVKADCGHHGVRFSKDNQWIYAAITGDNVVTVINVRTMNLEKKISAEKFPFWTAIKDNP